MPVGAEPPALPVALRSARGMLAGEDLISFSLPCADPLQTHRGLFPVITFKVDFRLERETEKGLGNGGNPLAGKCVLGTGGDELIFRSNN